MDFIMMKQVKPIGIAYRYNGVLYGDGNGYTYIRVYLSKYPITKKTNKGIWIDIFGRKRFVLLSARKKYACLTQEEALESFKARKNRQIRILNSQLTHAKEALDQAETIEKALIYSKY
jgi:hypothetical protein